VIAAHRRRHRRIMGLLALLLPLLLALALAARPPAPENARLPAAAPAFPDDRR
jgi:hypothetical protein